MISRKEHLEQVNRFHDEVDKVIAEIESGNRNFEILQKYFDLTSTVWPLIDDCLDTVKNRLDVLESTNII